MTWLIFYKNNYKIKTYFGLKLGPLVSRIDLTAMALTEAVLLNNFFHLTFGACSPSIVTLTKNLSGCFVSAENLSKVLLSSDILMVMAECFYIKTYSHIKMLISFQVKKIKIIIILLTAPCLFIKAVNTIYSWNVPDLMFDKVFKFHEKDREHILIFNSCQ